MSGSAFEWRRRECLLAVGLAMFPVVASAAGAPFPTRPLRLVVPFPPGGGTDILARALSERIARDLGQAVVVDNRPGASTALGADMVAKAAPDGHTLLLGTGSTYVTNTLLYRHLPYDPKKDLQALAVISRMEMLLVVNASAAANTVQKLIQHAKAKPGAMAYASPGNGTVHHLSMELFKDRAGIDMTHVPYKGAAETLRDLLGERIDAMFLDFATARALIESKRIKVLGVASSQRLKALPDVPTLAESGLPGFEVSGWFGLSTTAKVPANARSALENAVAGAMAEPAVQQQLISAGFTPAYAGSEEMSRLIVAEKAKWGQIIRLKNISAE